MTAQGSPAPSGITVRDRMRFHPKLRKLLEEDELDWDDPRHREAFLKAWLNTPREQEEDPVE